jgi:hypothetical protein
MRMAANLVQRGGDFLQRKSKINEEEFLEE